MEGDVLCAQTPYTSKDAVRSVNCGRWAKTEKIWKFPATPWTCDSLIRALTADGTVNVCPRALALRARAVSVAAVLAEAGRTEQSPFVRTPMWAHQKCGLGLIRLVRRVQLAWDPGVGKTLPALAAIAELGGDWFIMCPAAVIAVWRGEVRDHLVDPDAVRIVAPDRGTPTAKRLRQFKKLLSTSPGDSARIVVLNYEAGITKSLAALLADHPWRGGILDEAHRASNATTKTNEMLRTIHCEYLVELTGTPMRNSPLDIFGQLLLIDVGLLGRWFTRFRDTYAHVDTRMGFPQIRGFKNLRSLADRVALVQHVVRIDEVHDLPAKRHQQVLISMPKEAREIYVSMEACYLAEIDGVAYSAANAGARLVRLQQITSGYLPKSAIMDAPLDEHGVEIIHDAKAAQLAADLESLPVDEPVVVFCRFKRDLAAVHITAARSARESFELSGARHEWEAWAAASGGEVLAVQCQSGGEGISLVRACNAIFMSVGNMSPGQFDQIVGRLVRPKQKRPVLFKHYAIQKTVDVSAYRALTCKQSMIEAVREDIQRALAGATA